MEKTARLEWTGGLGFKADTGLGGSTTLAGDEGEPGARPTELLLTALGACTGMDVAAILAKKRQEPDRYVVHVTGSQRPEHPQTFVEITVEHEVEGSQVEPEAIRRSVELSATRYCPVNAHLSASDVRVSHRYVARNADGEHRAQVVVTGPHGAGLDVPRRAP